jgi:hypothetical protein
LFIRSKAKDLQLLLHALSQPNKTGSKARTVPLQKTFFEVDFGQKTSQKSLYPHPPYSDFIAFSTIKIM